MFDNLFDMASEEANRLVLCVIDVLKDRRQSLRSEMSLNSFASSTNLDASMLSRAETKQRIPSLAFFLDWCDGLEITLEEVVQEARRRL